MKLLSLKIAEYFCFILFLSFLHPGCIEQNQSTEKPNFLFILVDDLGLHDLSCAGSNYYETPNVDQIAANGMVFTQGYSSSRVCSPSRASIMTGQYTAHHGITDWIGARTGSAWRELNRHDILLPADYNHLLSHEDVTIAEALKAKDYATFYSGKWHLGSEGSYPEDHGFDINKGGWEKGSPIGGYYSPWTNPKLENKFKGENLSIRLAKETATFIQENQDTNFFAVLSFYAVHGPIQTTREKWLKYRNKAEALGIDSSGFEMERVLPIRKVQDNPIYAGLVETMDDAVGIVLDQLKTSGLDQNTVVIFTSDNGGVASGDAYSTTNLPLRGGKGYQWEGGIRVPYFIYVPWMNLENNENDTPVTGSDIYPTILELAGIPIPSKHQVDGQSLVPLLQGNKLETRKLIWHYPHYGNQGGNPSSIIRSDNWKLIHYWEDGKTELYNLVEDPSEVKDLSDDHTDITNTLDRELITYLDSRKAQYPIPDELYNADSSALRHKRIIEKNMPHLENQRINFLNKNFDPGNEWWGSSLIDD